MRERIQRAIDDLGYLLGETRRRATGRPLSTSLRELLTEPLSVEAEVHLSVPENLLERAATRVTLVSRGRLALMAAPALSRGGPGVGLPRPPGCAATAPTGRGVEGRAGSTFGMIGMNGSAAWADVDTGVAVAVMRNRVAAGDLTAVRTVGKMVRKGGVRWRRR